MPTLTVTTTANPCAVTPNEKRSSITMVNTDSTNSIYLRSNYYAPGLTVTSGNNEYVLAPQQSIAFQVPIHGARITKGSFQAIAGAGSPVMAWSEGYDR